MVGFKIFFFFFWGSGRFQLVQLIEILVCSITLIWPLLSWPLVFLKSSFILKFWFVLLRILATIIQIIRVMLSCNIREKENFFFFQFPLKPMPPSQSWTLVRVSAFSENFCGKRRFQKRKESLWPINSHFLVFMENRKHVGQPRWRICITGTSWKHFTDLTAPLFGAAFDILIKCQFQYQSISIFLFKFLYYLVN